MSREYSDERSVLVPVVVSEWSDQFGLAQATAGFLAGYGDVTRRAYALDLEQWAHSRPQLEPWQCSCCRDSAPSE